MERKEYEKKYRREHRLEINAYQREYAKTHREQKNIIRRKWYLTHKKEIMAINKKWQTTTERGKAWSKRKRIRDDIKHQAKRRKLGNKILTCRKLSPNIKIEYHHITSEYMIPIPKEIHRSVHHNIWTGKGMNEINSKIFNYLTRE